MRKFTPAGGDALVDASFCDPVTEFCAVGNATSYLTALNDAEVTLVHVSRVFSLSTFDASFAPPAFLDFSGVHVHLSLVGTKVDGSTVGGLVDLVEGANGNFNFSTSNLANLFGDTFSLLTSLTFSACFETGLNQCERGGEFLNSAQFAIDNLALEIPEPSVLWLTAFGFGALALSRRRRNRSGNRSGNAA